MKPVLFVSVPLLKAKLAEYLKRVQKGKEIIVSDRHLTIAKISTLDAS